MLVCCVIDVRTFPRKPMATEQQESIESALHPERLLRYFLSLSEHSLRFPETHYVSLVEMYFMNQLSMRKLFSAGDDFHVLGVLNDLYGRAVDAGGEDAAVLVQSLHDYYFQTGRHSSLPLEEAQSGLQFREIHVCGSGLSRWVAIDLLSACS
jgi:hypothetical protein